MTTKAPDLYSVDSPQLAAEMRYVDVASSMQWGKFTIITGVRCHPVNCGAPQPILIIKSGGHDPMHLISLLGSDSGRLHEAEPRIRDTDGSLKNSF